MTRRKKIKISIIVLFLGIILWQFGYFSRYNYLTAKIDCLRDQPRIVQIGVSNFNFSVPIVSLNEKYGFHEYNTGCMITSHQLRGIESYNTEVEKYLNKRNGKDWRKKHELELNQLIDNNLTE